MARENDEKVNLIKRKMEDARDKSTETILSITDTNSRYLEVALEAAKKSFDAIDECRAEGKIKERISRAIRRTFSSSLELAEDTLDAIIDSCTRQMELNDNFYRKMIEAAREMPVETHERILSLIQESVEASHQMLVKNVAEMCISYNRNTSLAYHFSEKFRETIQCQLDILFRIQQEFPAVNS